MKKLLFLCVFLPAILVADPFSHTEKDDFLAMPSTGVIITPLTSYNDLLYRTVPPLTTEWIGGITWQGVSKIDPAYKHDQFFRSDIEIGIRSDGVVVWRKKE